MRSIRVPLELTVRLVLDAKVDDVLIVFCACSLARDFECWTWANMREPMLLLRVCNNVPWQ
jgi:hypothetical protein